MSYIMIGKALFHIGFVGVIKDTKEIKTDIEETAAKTGVTRRTDDFMRAFGAVNVNRV